MPEYDSSRGQWYIGNDPKTRRYYKSKEDAVRAWQAYLAKSGK
jgi:hypothetical protein